MQDPFRPVLSPMHRIPLPAALLLAALAAAGCASPAAAPRAPVDPRTRIPPGVRPEWLHFRDSLVAPGERAPAFALPTPDGGTTLSLDLFLGRPLVVIFGSYT